MPIDTCLVFAAGFGTRMGALTQNTPKPMLPLAGRPMIDFGIDLLRSAGISRIFVNTHYHADQIQQHLGSHPDITCIHEPDILETGGGLKNALPLIDRDAVLTLNSDAVFLGPNPIQDLITAWETTRYDALLCCVTSERAQNHRGLGDFHKGLDGGLTRRRGTENAQFVYTGAQILKTDPVRAIAKTAFSLNEVWDTLIAQKSLGSTEFSGNWFDVGTAEGLQRTNDALSEAGYV